MFIFDAIGELVYDIGLATSGLLCDDPAIVDHKGELPEERTEVHYNADGSRTIRKYKLVTETVPKEECKKEESKPKKNTITTVGHEFGAPIKLPPSSAKEGQKKEEQKKVVLDLRMKDKEYALDKVDPDTKEDKMESKKDKPVSTAAIVRKDPPAGESIKPLPGVNMDFLKQKVEEVQKPIFDQYAISQAAMALGIEPVKLMAALMNGQINSALVQSQPIQNQQYLPSPQKKTVVFNKAPSQEKTWGPAIPVPKDRPQVPIRVIEFDNRKILDKYPDLSQIVDNGAKKGIGVQLVQGINENIIMVESFNSDGTFLPHKSFLIDYGSIINKVPKVFVLWDVPIEDQNPFYLYIRASGGSNKDRKFNYGLIDRIFTGGYSNIGKSCNTIFSDDRIRLNKYVDLITIPDGKAKGKILDILQKLFNVGGFGFIESKVGRFSRFKFADGTVNEKDDCFQMIFINSATLLGHMMDQAIPPCSITVNSRVREKGGEIDIKFADTVYIYNITETGDIVSETKIRD